MLVGGLDILRKGDELGWSRLSMMVEPSWTACSSPARVYETPYRLPMTVSLRRVSKEQRQP